MSVQLQDGIKNQVSHNIRELHQGPQFKKTSANHGKKVAQKQAIAIALSQARKQPPGPEESPKHEAMESPRMERREHEKKSKHQNKKVRRLFGKE